MSEFIIITLGFGPADIIHKSMTCLYETRNQELPVTHYMLDQHYPVNKEENRKQIAETCRYFGIKLIDAGRNLGLARGFNHVLETVKPKPGSIIIAYDPDTKPITPGWDMALVRAICGDPEQLVVWSSLIHDGVEDQLPSVTQEERFADGFIKMNILNQPVMNSISAFEFDWLNRVGGLSEPNSFYGGLEVSMWHKLQGKQWAFLPDWAESSEFRGLHDEAYTAYKYLHANTKLWPGDFETWIEAGKPSLDQVPRIYFNN